jgi:hypothetical protein
VTGVQTCALPISLAYLKLRHLGQYFMEPSDYFDAPTYKILRFIRSAELLRG